MEKFYEKLAEILDVDTLADSDTLESFEEWDSIAVISLLAFADKVYDVRLSTGEIRACKTVGDLASAIRSKTGI